jgi:hypothetical protein
LQELCQVVTEEAIRQPMDEAGALCIDFEGLVQFSVPTKRIWCKYIWNFAENV